MTPEKQRIAIAEACGWHIDKSITGPVPQWKHPTCARWQDDPPDYLNDLNAMHDAEKVLDKERRATYAECLTCAIRDQETPGFYHERFILISLTAAQRAEAFLRTTNRWSVTQSGQ